MRVSHSQPLAFGLLALSLGIAFVVEARDQRVSPVIVTIEPYQGAESSARPCATEEDVDVLHAAPPAEPAARTLAPKGPTAGISLERRPPVYRLMDERGQDGLPHLDVWIARLDPRGAVVHRVRATTSASGELERTSLWPREPRMVLPVLGKSPFVPTQLSPRSTLLTAADWVDLRVMADDESSLVDCSVSLSIHGSLQSELVWPVPSGHHALIPLPTARHSAIRVTASNYPAKRVERPSDQRVLEVTLERGFDLDVLLNPWDEQSSSQLRVTVSGLHSPFAEGVPVGESGELKLRHVPAGVRFVSVFDGPERVYGPRRVHGAPGGSMTVDLRSNCALVLIAVGWEATPTSRIRIARTGTSWSEVVRCDGFEKKRIPLPGSGVYSINHVWNDGPTTMVARADAVAVGHAEAKVVDLASTLADREGECLTAETGD